VCATRLHRTLILYNDNMVSRGATHSGSVSAPKFATARTTVGGMGATQTSRTLGVGVEVDVQVRGDDASDAFPMSKLDRSPSGTSVVDDERKRMHDSMV